MSPAVTRFETTRWSVVARARGTTPDARTALESLCRAYRTPVLAYIRARGYMIEAGEDLAHFFARFLEEAYHTIADPRGRFPAFLLTALKRFLINTEGEPRALKRGGAVRIDQLLENTQAGNSTTMVDDSTPEREFGRRRVIAILDVAVSRLRGEVEAAGKRAMFDQLHEFLSGRPDDADYERPAAALSMRRNTVAVAVPALSSARSGARRAEADDYRARGIGRRAAGIAVRTAGLARAGPTV
jgi:RNA polymerase sigma-70 factor (ECF subfamily)